MKNRPQSRKGHTAGPWPGLRLGALVGQAPTSGQGRGVLAPPLAPPPEVQQAESPLQLPCPGKRTTGTTWYALDLHGGN